MFFLCFSDLLVLTPPANVKALIIKYLQGRWKVWWQKWAARKVPIITLGDLAMIRTWDSAHWIVGGRGIVGACFPVTVPGL